MSSMPFATKAHLLLNNNYVLRAFAIAVDVRQCSDSSDRRLVLRPMLARSPSESECVRHAHPHTWLAEGVPCDIQIFHTPSRLVWLVASRPSLLLFLRLSSKAQIALNSSSDESLPPNGKRPLSSSWSLIAECDRRGCNSSASATTCDCHERTFHCVGISSAGPWHHGGGVCQHKRVS